MSGTYYKSGVWNAICDRCGFEFKSNELKLEWDNLRVCSNCWEPRNPLDFSPRIPLERPAPWTRPEPADDFVDIDWFSGYLTQRNGFYLTQNNGKRLIVQEPET